MENSNEIEQSEKRNVYGWEKIISFFIPLAGFFLYAVNKDKVDGPKDYLVYTVARFFIEIELILFGTFIVDVQLLDYTDSICTLLLLK